MASSPILILGGTSLVATYLAARLKGTGRTIQLVARRTTSPIAGLPFVPWSELAAGVVPATPGAAVISLLPLPVLISLLPRLTGVRSIAALGSTSVFSKATSDEASERATAGKLAAAERALEDWCGTHGVGMTLLRPTLVYDLVSDRNVARLARFARRFGFVPLAKPAKGLRQPIHADDVAKALLAAVDTPAAFGKRLNIAGGAPLTYRAMVERIFAGLGRKPRLVLLPTAILRVGFSAGSRLGLVREAAFGSSVFSRMNEDLTFDVRDGLELLGYDPRPFDPAGPLRLGDLDAQTVAALT